MISSGVFYVLVLFISLIGSSDPDKDLHIHINALNGVRRNRLAPQSGGIGDADLQIILSLQGI